MHQHPNTSRNVQPPLGYQKKRKNNHLFIFLPFILLCAIAWPIGSYLANGNVQQEYGLTCNTSDNLAASNPTHLQEPILYHSQEPMPYPVSYQTDFQVFTFEQLIQMSNDHLLLVNNDYAIPIDMINNLIKLSDYVNTLDPEMLLRDDALVMLRVMFDSASSTNFNQFRVTQGFRTYEQQQYLYLQMAGDGLAARPGHSEHQVGLAVDISYHGVNIGNSVQGAWLMNNSYKYGFILRYPEHKTHITGVPFEPWHYRYVGQPHAYFMTYRDFVLEEYIDYLRSNREISISFEGIIFNIYYLLGEDDVLKIPDGYAFLSSRDNTGGVIITAWRT